VHVRSAARGLAETIAGAILMAIDPTAFQYAITSQDERLEWSRLLGTVGCAFVQTMPNGDGWELMSINVQEGSVNADDFRCFASEALSRVSGVSIQASDLQKRTDFEHRKHCVFLAYMTAMQKKHREDDGSTVS
jgi:hypothetical protein